MKEIPSNATEVVEIADVQKTFAQTLGAVLVLIGLLGFFNDPVLGIFEVNTLHNIVHLASGGLAFFAVSKGAARAFNKWFGVAYLVVAVLGFLGALSFLEVASGSNSDNWLHVVLGIVPLAVALGLKEGA